MTTERKIRQQLNKIKRVMKVMMKKSPDPQQQMMKWKKYKMMTYKYRMIIIMKIIFKTLMFKITLKKITFKNKNM